jgi:hypothetical protein
MMQLHPHTDEIQVKEEKWDHQAENWRTKTPDGNRFFPKFLCVREIVLVIRSMLAFFFETLRPFSSDCSSPYYSHPLKII